MNRTIFLTAILLGVLLPSTSLAHQDGDAPEFTLYLPEWDPDPEDLPPELQPLDIERPVLPEDVGERSR